MFETVLFSCSRFNLALLYFVLISAIAKNKTVDIFKSGGGEKMAQDMNAPFLGKIPLDPNIVEAGDSGKPFLYFYSETPTAKILEEIILSS